MLFLLLACILCYIQLLAAALSKAVSFIHTVRSVIGCCRHTLSITYFTVAFSERF